MRPCNDLVLKCGATAETIAVTVLDSQGHPVPDVSVNVTLQVCYEDGSRDCIPFSGVTDANGFLDTQVPAGIYHSVDCWGLQVGSLTYSGEPANN